MATKIAAQFPILHMQSAQSDGWQSRVARFDSRQTVDVLTRGTGVLTSDQVMLLEEARRAFAADARRQYYVQDDAGVAQLLRSIGHVRKVLSFGGEEPQSTSGPELRARLELTATATKRRVVYRAVRAEWLKLRVARAVPLHEWQDALRRGENAVKALLEVYAPNAERVLPARIAPRCPPWAPRKYRGAVQPMAVAHG